MLFGLLFLPFCRMVSINPVIFSDRRAWRYFGQCPCLFPVHVVTHTTRYTTALYMTLLSRECSFLFNTMIVNGENELFLLLVAWEAAGCLSSCLIYSLLWCQTKWINCIWPGAWGYVSVPVLLSYCLYLCWKREEGITCAAQSVLKVWASPL